MARTNKYASINFNNVYDKNITNNKSNNNQTKQSSSSASYSSLGSSHGRMLVLTRPTPKPASIVASTPPLSPSPQNSSTQLAISQDQQRVDSEFDSISLRPSGRTGPGSCAVQIPELKANKFVPPHLRPGFVKKEERKDVGQRPQHGYVGVGSGSGSPDGYGDNGRPKSGGGYERMRRGGESGLDFGNRPRSSGNRPNSSG
ncbi:uncharacterized protein LOC126655864 [Mercurialis annua]|uniref:uncharacterized protein LOC126655864 n=1 Tax=Mercurialis annua TaxID=3986 RepID=UPI00215E05CB|nr:uncharacterized protein LOC126655864 [Mercurialis annua]